MKQFLITLEDLEKLNGLIKINLRDDNNRTFIKDGINVTEIAYVETMENAKDYIRNKFEEYFLSKYYNEEAESLLKDMAAEELTEELIEDILEEYCINMNEANDSDIIEKMFKSREL